MKVNDLTRYWLAQKRFTKKAIADGWEHVGERGGQMWELHRGSRTGQVIKEVMIDHSGESLWIKTS